MRAMELTDADEHRLTGLATNTSSSAPGRHVAFRLPRVDAAWSCPDKGRDGPAEPRPTTRSTWGTVEPSPVECSNEDAVANEASARERLEKIADVVLCLASERAAFIRAAFITETSPSSWTGAKAWPSTDACRSRWRVDRLAVRPSVPGKRQRGARSASG